MTLFLSFVLLSLVFVDDDFLLFILSENFTLDNVLGSFCRGFDSVFVRYEQNVERNLIADFGVEFLELYYIVYGNFVRLLPFSMIAYI